MPTQTRFITISGAVSLDLSGVFEDLGGGSAYTSATNFKVGSTDLTGLFHKSTSESDRPNFNTKFLVNGTDLSAIFRRRGFSGFSITTQPESQIKNEGQTATFTIVASSTSGGTITYQWKKWDGDSFEPISGANSASYTTSTLTDADNGNQYICTATLNGTESIDSSIATLTVYYVTITDQPDAASLNEGNALLLSIIASVNPIPSGCQWQFSTHNANSWSNISSATGSSFSKSVVPEDDGDYRCVVSNSGASVTENSTPAYIQIYYQSKISTQPYQDPSPVVANGTNDVDIKIVANGKTSPTYKWQENISSTWTDLSNAGRISNVTTATLSIANVESGDDQRQFRCVLSNLNATNDPFSDTTSNSVTLNVNYAPSSASITGQETYDVTNIISFTASVTLGKPTSTTYNWYRSTNGGSTYSLVSTTSNTTSTSNEYVVGSATNDMSGYKYKCVISNSVGSVETSVKTIFINANIVTQPTDVTVNEGGTAVFSLTAGGTAPLHYQWYRENSAIGSSANAFADSSRTRDNDGDEYYCVVSGSNLATATSSTRTLSVIYFDEYYYDAGWSALPENGQITFTSGDLHGLKVTGNFTYTGSKFIWQQSGVTGWTDDNAERSANLLPTENADQNTFYAEPSHSGYWRCKITNSFNGSPFYSNIFNVTVQ